MSAIQQLLTDHIDIWTAAETEKKSGRGRASGNAATVYGIKKLRALILDFAMRGKLVPQDANDAPASELLKFMQIEKAKLIASGKIRKDKSLAAISDEEIPYTIPNNWKWLRLPDSYYPIPVSGNQLLSSDIKTAGTFPVIDQGQRFIAGYTDDENLLIRIPGPVIVFGDHTTARKFIDFDFVAGADGVKILRPIAINEKFFWLQLVSLKLEGRGYARHYKVLNECFFAVPPLSEQARIVAKIDELMALCDQLEAQHVNAADAHEQLVTQLLGTLTQSQNAADSATNWQRVAAHFDTLFTTEASVDALKQTLLQLAVMGKLVAQDVNDEPASELLKRIQAEKAKFIAEGRIKKDKQVAFIASDAQPFELPQNWEWVSFDHIAENSKHALKAGPFGSALKKDMYCENGYKIYGQEQVISGDENLGNYYINEEKFRELSSCAVKSGDILISLVGTIGRVLALSEKCEEGIINPRLVKISLFNEINRYFMKIIFASPLLKNEMANKSHGGTMDILNLGLLRAFALPLPPINEQRRIVTKVDELMEFCDQLRSRIAVADQQQKKLADVLVEHAVIG